MRYGLLDAWESLSDPPSGRSPVGLGRSPTRLDFDRLAARHTELSSLDQPHRMEAPRRFLGLHWPLQRLSRRPFDAVSDQRSSFSGSRLCHHPFDGPPPTSPPHASMATPPHAPCRVSPAAHLFSSVDPFPIWTSARSLADSARETWTSADAHALGASGHVQAYRGKLIHVALD